MATLGIFTVKKLVCHRGGYWTYGGFGAYLRAILPYFGRVLLVAHVAPGGPEPGYYPIAHPKLEVVALPPTRSEVGVMAAIPRMAHIARQVVREVDVVHARMPDYTGIIGALAARRQGVPCFHQIVADWCEEARRINPWKKAGLGVALKAHLSVYDWVERRTCRGQLVFAQGQSCHAKHARLADAHLVVSAAHHAADLVSPAEKFTRRPFQLLNVARLNSVKNQGLLLRVLRDLHGAGGDWRLTLVGAGPHRSRLQRETVALGLADRVTFAGMVEPGPALWRYYDAADVFVLPSRSEGTPKVVLEAMTRGLPVVAANVSGVPTLVAHERTGLLFEDNNPDSLLNAIQRYEREPVLRQKVALAGSAFAREHTVEAETERMMRTVFARWPHLRPIPTVAPTEYRCGPASEG
ncbi:MAG: glycosyltransferase [Acidobacteriota bacterium]